MNNAKVNFDILSNFYPENTELKDFEYKSKNLCNFILTIEIIDKINAACKNYV